MKPKRFLFKIDTIQNTRNPYFEVVAGDYQTNIFDFEITQDGEPYDLTGLNVEIDFYKPDGNLNRQDMNTGVEIADEENGKVSCVLEPNSINVEGRIRGEIKISQGLEILTTCRFEFLVRMPLATDDIVESDTNFPILTQLIARVDTLEEEITLAEEERADAEAIRQFNEEERERAEAERESRYEEAESNRDTQFAISQAARQTAYEQAENARNALYANAESNRDSQYAEAESERNTQYNSAEETRDGLYDSAEADRYNQYSGAETTRENTFAQKIAAMEANYSSKEDERDSLYQQAEADRDDLYAQAEAHRDELYEQAEAARDEKLNQTQLKTTKIEKELQDYKATMALVNINQEAKQKVEGYGVVSLPKNAANGQIGVVVKGNTEVDELGNVKSTFSAMRLKSVGKNLFDGVIGQGSISDTTGLDVPANGNYRTQNYIKVEKGQTYSVSLLTPISGRSIAYYDNNKNFIIREAMGAATTFTPQQDGYVRLRFYSPTIPVTEESKLMINKGTTPLPYEPYTESNAYVIATDKDTGKILELRSLPNGTKDEIRVSDGKLIKRVSDEFTPPMSGWRFDLINEQGFAVLINYTTLPNFASQEYGEFRPTTGMVVNNSNLPAYTTNSSLTIRATANTECIATGRSGTNLYIVVHQDNYNKTQDSAGANAWVNENMQGVTLTYQLAQEQVIPVQVSGTLVGFPSGTVYWEQIVPDAGVYTDKMEVLHKDLPIKSIEKLSKVDFTTGVEYELDPSQAVVSANRLSFTHPELQEGDITFFIYAYEKESTTPEMTIQYYDSRYVVKDAVTGKFYKWNIVVANGQPSIELVEV